MSDVEPVSQRTEAGRFHPLLLCCFVGSGLAALIYEVIWFQLLEFIIGSTATSLAVLLGTFMGGMCLGSLVFARVIRVSLHPLKVYAALELGIGLIAILVWYFLPPAADLYANIGGQGFAGILFRMLLCAAFLLAPTVLMGATLPCAARWVERTPQGVTWLGILYTGNLAGAVFGCLLAGFYLLRLYDIATATFVAAAVNALCAALAFLLATLAPNRAPAAPAVEDRVPLRLETAAVYLTIALSGLTALGAQVVWTRLLSLLLGPSVYTFSIILAVFLLGLGLGGSLGRRWRAAQGRVRRAGLVSVPRSPPSPGRPSASTRGCRIGGRSAAGRQSWLTFQLDLARSSGPSCRRPVCGASFPLALAAAAPQHVDRAAWSGRSTRPTLSAPSSAHRFPASS
jgi:spermidine synthase